MPLDSITLMGLRNELSDKLTSARIDKVYQPDKEDIVISIRSGSENLKLLISSTSSARICFINGAIENPSAPPMFCMLLRKHIQGGRIKLINQTDFERILTIEITSRDDLGILSTKYLACEFLGRFSNIILYGEDNRIIDSIKRLDGERKVLPGLFYRPPAKQDKVSILDLGRDDIQRMILSANKSISVEKWILDSFLGFSPLITREISFRCSNKLGALIGEIDADMLICELEKIKEIICSKHYSPTMLIHDNECKDFSFMPILHYGFEYLNKEYECFSQLLTEFYGKKNILSNVKRASQELYKSVSLLKGKAVKKLNIHIADLEGTKNIDKNKMYGDLIVSNIYAIKPGEKKISVTNFYSENQEMIDINLDPNISPQANSQKYYKIYNKLKSSREYLNHQIPKDRIEIEYLESVLDCIDRSETIYDLEQIKEELRQCNYILSKQKSKKASLYKSKTTSQPYKYILSDGFVLLVGKNNIQNDELTLKTAYKTDIWFHAKNIPGAHAILITDGKEPTDLAYTEAAQIAAYHSKAKYSDKSIVDYTYVKNVKKAKGAKPGMVYYETYFSANVSLEKFDIGKFKSENK